LRTLLLGPPSPVSFELGGVSYETDWIKNRHIDYRHVCELQRVTPLAALYRMYDAAINLIGNQGSTADNIQVLETASKALAVVEVPKALRVTGKERDNLLAYRPQKIAQTIGQLRQKTAKRKVDPKDIEKLCRDLIGDMNPQVKIALTGVIYAYYFRPGDLLVSEDPLFLRKHEFIDLGPAMRRELFRSEPDLSINSEGAGSYLTGGFAGFSPVAGKVAASGPHRGGNTEIVVASQIGSLRATDWRSIGDNATLLFGLKIRLAREWVQQASTNPELFSSLGEAALGIISLSRRADLLNGLRSGDWNAVWQAVTLSDLYFLSDNYLSRYKSEAWHSPVTRDLQRLLAGAGVSQLAALGASHVELNGCGHPHLMRLAPYEEYERALMPAKMAERVTELQLYLIDYAGQAGIPAAALGAVAEPVAVDLLRKLQMADMRDWRPVPLAFASVSEQNIAAVLH
jgi:hypothetical protein